ncbi:peptidoglycan-recognition protein SC2-like isoform X2 [Zophobas morio]|uniref:peptidoglycan-recognition protein SC2-like isoform X2 n=1 Tax=Zophobas morio TaxID=2755281 RepID=UPI0030838BE0
MAIGVVPGSSTAHNNNDSESESCKTSKTWQNLKDTRISNFRLKHIVSVLVCALGLMMILITIFIIILSVRGNTTSKSTNVAAEESMLVDDSGNKPKLPGKVKLVSRLEWAAQPPVEPATPLHTSVPYVIIHHTQTENCSSQAQCVLQVRFIQTYHIESRGWWDIGYNFLVGGNGEAYDGRGWKSEGAHTSGYNAQSIGIAFIGTFDRYKPPERQIRACKLLIAKGVELGYIKKDYKLLTPRQLQTTKSPGDALYEELKTWEHWAESP